MLKRISLILLLTFVPAVAFADDAPPADPATPAAEAASPESPAPAATPSGLTAPGATPPGQAQSAVGGASSLGPSAASGAGGSTGDSGTLQPAGTQQLQSGQSASNGLTAPSNALQSPVAGDAALSVIRGDLDGSPHADTAPGQGPNWNWLFIALAFGLLVSGSYLLLRFFERRAER